MFKFTLAFALAISFSLSSISHAAPQSLRESILSQLMSSNKYAEKKFTGIIFYYGQFIIDPDKLSDADAEELLIIMKKGRFIENDFTHDVRGVEWILMPSKDRPWFFQNISPSFFNIRNKSIVKSSYPNLKIDTVYQIRWNDYPIIPEYLEMLDKQALEQQGLLGLQIGQELNRITDSNIGSSNTGQLLLPAPTCNGLF
jgi:hypothetical protein